MSDRRETETRERTSSLYRHSSAGQ